MLNFQTTGGEGIGKSYLEATYFRWVHLVAEDSEMLVVLSSVMGVDIRYEREQIL